jgi:hypothetical protein
MKGFFACVALAALVTSARAETIADPQPVGFPGVVALTGAQRKMRAEIIRDSAAVVGMTNAALLAGIGEVETNFAHCWSEATWACQGPASASCGGGPVIAGSADGPCSLQQGGLGMFQFDAGTYSQTVAMYGPSIVTMQGNVDAVVPFLVTRAIQSVQGVSNQAEALAWMNSIKIQDGDPQYEKWLYFVAWRYNGCMGCTTQINKYRAGTNKLRDEFGAGFWTVTAEPVACAPIAATGRTIDDKDGCFTKTGSLASWYPSTKGMDGACWFTYTTDDAQPANQGTWELAFKADGRYLVEVYTDASIAQTHRASYTVAHAGGETAVMIDQTATTGFQALGEFDFVAGAPALVHLGDNTGEPYVSTAKVAIMFDAVRVTPAASHDDGSGSGTGGDGDDELGGGCSTTGSGSPFVLLFVLGALISARRTYRS